ncbi:MAG: Asp23/Gls24 family envelope stress response protein [Firmicutes bacterium HGW-Firmicutes-11]|nr:MAG: Asp23/Gls24 family envelope stress response protein [Firmicutes bacterium HGW-Firmicutes-11]
MATNNNEDKVGTVKIADDVIAVCVLNATLKTAGVSALSGGLTDSLSRNLLGKEPVYKGIKINQGDDGVVIDISVIVEYGVKIPAVAWDVQENVKNEVEEIIDIPVIAVNIHVAGVHFKDDSTAG